MRDTRTFEIGPYLGSREALRSLFRLADESETEIGRYIMLGDILVARRNGGVLGHIQIVEGAEGGTAEITSLAVAAPFQGKGIGRKLVEAGILLSRDRGARKLMVSTATGDIENLRFYQRRGFRLTHIERDAFSTARGYPEGAASNGIPLRDKAFLELLLPTR